MGICALLTDSHVFSMVFVFFGFSGVEVRVSLLAEGIAQARASVQVYVTGFFVRFGTTTTFFYLRFTRETTRGFFFSIWEQYGKSSV